VEREDWLRGIREGHSVSGVWRGIAAGVLIRGWLFLLVGLIIRWQPNQASDRGFALNELGTEELQPAVLKAELEDQSKHQYSDSLIKN
jgi:hypothetical protein